MHRGLDASGGPSYCLARSDRARRAPAAASAVADQLRLGGAGIVPTGRQRPDLKTTCDGQGL
eukprot:7127159-Pyramimonas_sp.AAC.1